MAHFEKDPNANPLKQYRSYSYHHILIACDSTETALLLERRGTITELQRTRQAQGDRELKYRGYPVRPGSTDKNYVILIDGLVDADFYIRGANWSTVMSPYEQGQEAMMEVEGTIDIFEPYGAVFLERLVNVCSELGTDPNGLVFLLKTVFVGYNDDDHQYNVEMLSNVRPFLFNITNITSVVDESGAQYELEVFGAQDGFAKTPQVSNIGKSFSFTIDPSKDLETTLKLAMQGINNQYFAQAALIEGVSVTLDTTAPDTDPLREKRTFTKESEYRPVIYEVTAPKYAQGYHAGTNQPDANDDTVNTKTLNFGPDTSVEKVIEAIMRSSAEVMRDAADDAEEKYIFKINSYLKSTPSNVTIMYQVNKYEVPVEPYSAQVANAPQSVPEDEVKTYDYIFTGQNTDILELDIKMNYGLAFFHTAAMTAYNFSQDQQRGGVKPKQAPMPGGEGGAARNDTLPRKKTPLFLGDKVTKPLVRNSEDPISTSAFQALLERHAGIENISLTFKIHGDPTLLSETLVFADTPPTIENVGQTKEKTYLSAPLLFRINIQMPTDENRNEFRPFWYRGLYMLHQIEHEFNNGEFTQTLTVFSVPSTAESISPEKSERKAKGEVSETISSEPAAATDTPTEDLTSDDVEAANSGRIGGG